MSLLMNLEVSFVYCCIATYITNMVLFLGVYLSVACQFIWTPECLLAYFTHIWAFFGVNPHVIIQVFAGWEHFLTNWTFDFLCQVMRSHMKSQSVLAIKWFSTRVTSMSKTVTSWWTCPLQPTMGFTNTVFCKPFPSWIRICSRWLFWIAITFCRGPCWASIRNVCVMEGFTCRPRKRRNIKSSSHINLILRTQLEIQINCDTNPFQNFMHREA